MYVPATVVAAVPCIQGPVLGTYTLVQWSAWSTHIVPSNILSPWGPEKVQSATSERTAAQIVGSKDKPH